MTLEFFDDRSDNNGSERSYVVGIDFDELLPSARGSKGKQGFNNENPVVYLAGPILFSSNTSFDYSPCLKWRNEITELFQSDPEIVWDVRDPTFGKTNLERTQYLVNEENKGCFNPVYIFLKDIQNVRESDFLVINLTQEIMRHSNQKGFGTAFECGTGYETESNLIYICELDSPYRQHPFIQISKTAIVQDISEAYFMTKFLLENQE